MTASLYVPEHVCIVSLSQMAFLPLDAGVQAGIAEPKYTG
jgi:hypothetical protein